MGLSNVTGASSILQPGVCTSSTRPASPYDGQVIYETDTDKVAVYDSSSWVYKTGTSHVNPAMVLLASAELSSVTSFTLDNVFSANYQVFQILIRNTGNSAAVTIQLRVGGVAATTNYNRQETDTGGTTMTIARTTGQPSIYIGAFGSAASHANIMLYSPNQATPTIADARSSHGASYDIAQPKMVDVLTFHTTSTAYDGFAVTAANANTLIGRYWVYGLVGAL